MDKIANNDDVKQEIADGRAVDKVDNRVEQEIAHSRTVDRASCNINVSIGISERNNAIDKIANNVDIKEKIANRVVDKVDNIVEQEIAGSTTVDRASSTSTSVVES